MEPKLGQEQAEIDVLADSDERRVLFAALDSLKQYRRAAHLNVTHYRRQNLYALPSSHMRLLVEPPLSLLENLIRVDDAIDCNADIAEAILECGLEAYGLPREPEPGQLLNWQGYATSSDLDKAHSTIRQLYRDWSAEGTEERKSCYDYVLSRLRSPPAKYLTSTQHTFRPKILVPGAGLSRLVYEICRAGNDVQGNEISYLQLLASNWILNHANTTPRPLYPFATQFSNLFSREQQLQKVMIPDVHPGEDIREAWSKEGIVGEMSMTAADFVVLYSGGEYRARFDAVVTVFFIDTAPNFLRYLDTVLNCLRTNGIWINVGPLLWHSDGTLNASRGQGKDDEREAHVLNGAQNLGIGEPGSFELTDEEVMKLLEMRGFQLEHREVLSNGVGYIQDAGSMLERKYRASCWVAMKQAE